MKTNTTTQFFGKNSMATSDCIAIAFFRPSGSNEVAVNGIPIPEGTTLSISQNVGDFDVSQYEIQFTAGASTNELYVIRTLILG